VGREAPMTQMMRSSVLGIRSPSKGISKVDMVGGKAWLKG
jgi:hypothetical protein